MAGDKEKRLIFTDPLRADARLAEINDFHITFLTGQRVRIWLRSSLLCSEGRKSFSFALVCTHYYAEALGFQHHAMEISKRSFICTVRPTVHTNPSRKRSFFKTLFKPEEFENAGFSCSCGRRTFWKRSFLTTMTSRYSCDFPTLGIVWTRAPFVVQSEVSCIWNNRDSLAHVFPRFVSYMYLPGNFVGSVGCCCLLWYPILKLKFYDTWTKTPLHITERIQTS